MQLGDVDHAYVLGAEPGQPSWPSRFLYFGGGRLTRRLMNLLHKRSLMAFAIALWERRREKKSGFEARRTMEMRSQKLVGANELATKEFRIGHSDHKRMRSEE